MTSMDATIYDDTAGRKKRRLIAASLCAAVVAAIFTYLSWNWPAERRVDELLTAVEKNDLPRAFAIWNNDPGWQQHAEKYAAANYPYGRFVRDWTDAEYGTIRSHRIAHATSRYGNSTLVVVEINGRPTALLTLAVEKHGHTMNFSPFTLTPGQSVLGLPQWQLSDR